MTVHLSNRVMQSHEMPKIAYSSSLGTECRRGAGRSAQVERGTRSRTSANLPQKKSPAHEHPLSTYRSNVVLLHNNLLVASPTRGHTHVLTLSLA